MNFGANNPTSFAFATPSATVNPLGNATNSIFTSQTGTTPVGLATTQPSLFGAATSTSAPNLFGATTGTSLFGGTNTTVSTGTTPSSGLFGQTKTISFATPISSTPSIFGAPNTSSFTLGGQPASFPSFGVPATTVTTTTPAAPLGLGGVDFSQVSGTKSSSAGKSDSKIVKEQVLPNEISESINSFRKYVKEQKVIREEISRVSSKPICKVQEETASLLKLVSVLTSAIQRNDLAIDRLKVASAKDLKNAEIAQRTKDLPPSMQFENTAPFDYFQDLVVDFEKQMHSYRLQIEQLEQYFVSLAKPSILSPQELNIVVRHLHETFVALAAQLQGVHDAVRVRKDTFLSIRRSMIGDATNIFERNKSDGQQVKAKITVPVTIGPAPFSSNPSAAAMAMASALNRAQQSSGLSGGSGFGNQQSSFSVFGNTPIKPLGNFGSGAFSSPSAFGTPVENKPFQLQKPPSGNKRGKRWTTN